MADPAAHGSYEVECPHCGKTFEAELLPPPSSSRPGGFKCPHCRLFVPLDRAGADTSG